MNVVETIKNYILNFIAKPHPSFSGFPICPFAYKSIISDEIDYQVDKISVETVLSHFKTMKNKMLMVIDQDKKITFKELEDVSTNLNQALKPLGYSSFTGHPEHDLCIDGLYTRRDPYPNILVIPIMDLVDGESSLKKTNYYDRWSAENLKYNEI